jgi:hypothetical protein
MPDTFEFHNLLVDIAPHCSVCGGLATRRYRDLGPDIHVFRIKMGELSKLAWTPISASTRSLTLEDIGKRTINWVQRELYKIGEIIHITAAVVEPWTFDQGPFFCDIHTGVYESLQYQDLNIASMVRRANHVDLATTEKTRPTRFDRILEDNEDG